MMILAFSRTTAAIEARRKSVTRREWSDAYFERVRLAFMDACFKGERGLRMQAWSASPHRGGKRIGIILVTSVARERTCLIPDSDWEAEGFAFMADAGIDVGPELSCEKLWRLWRQDPEKVTAVIRFEIVELANEGRAA